jgi:tight adherence protein B
MILSIHDYRRRVAFARQFADSLTLMANSLRAGFNLNQALRIAAEELPPPSGQEFDLVIRETELGAPFSLALENLARRMPGESMRIFVTAVNVAMRTGGEITKVFDNIVTTVRERERVEERVRTLTASGRLQGYGIAALPFLALLLRYIRSPDATLAFFQWRWGWVFYGVGIVFEIIGLVVIERVCRARV